jgi:hypothetical protein
LHSIALILFCPDLECEGGIDMQATARQQVLPRATSRPFENQSATTARDAKLGLASSLAFIWCEAWQVLVAQALPLLSFALIGCLAAIGLALFATAPSLGLGEVLQVMGGTLALSFARGGIAWLALHRSETLGFGSACRAVLKRLPALFVGSLVYSAVITAGAVGLGLALRHVHIKVPLIVHIPHRYTMPLQTHQLMTQAAKSFVAQSDSALIPDADEPLKTWLPALRKAALLREVEVASGTSNTAQLSGDAFYLMTAIYTPDNREFWWMTYASIALLLIAEVLLRARTVLVMGVAQANPIASLWRTLHFGIQHFGFIAVHVWMLRLAVFAFSVLFIILPVALVQEVVLPKLVFAMPYELLHVSQLIPQATAVCLALLSAFFATFGVVYDARLYRLLAARADAAVLRRVLVASLQAKPAQTLPRLARVGSAANLI